MKALNCCSVRSPIQLILVVSTEAQRGSNLVIYCRHGAVRTLSGTKHSVHKGATLHHPNYPETQTEHIAVGREPAAESLSSPSAVKHGPRDRDCPHPEQHDWTRGTLGTIPDQNTVFVRICGKSASVFQKVCLALPCPLASRS